MAGFSCLRSDLKRAAQHPEIDRRIIRSGAPFNSIVQQPATTPSAPASERWWIPSAWPSAATRWRYPRSGLGSLEIKQPLPSEAKRRHYRSRCETAPWPFMMSTTDHRLKLME